MSDLTTFLFGMPATQSGKSDDDAHVKLLFGKPTPMLDRGYLGAIAERLLQRAADYFDETLTKKNRKSLAVRIEGFIADIDQLHPVTFRPMIEHWHLTPELQRLLLMVRDVRSAMSEGNIDEALKAQLHRLARQSILASTAAKTVRRKKQADWIGPVIDRANELKRKNPKQNTSGIALEIERDATANPTRKRSEAIRKVLNKSKLS